MFDIAIVSLDLTISKKNQNQNYSGKEIGPRKKILEILGFLGFKYEKSNRRFTSSQPLFFHCFKVMLVIVRTLLEILTIGLMGKVFGLT